MTSQPMYNSQPMHNSGTLSSTLSSHVTIWGETHPGRVREVNEDSIFPDSTTAPFYNPKPETLNAKGRLLIVADGVGGAQAGNEASQWAIRRAVERYYELPGQNLGEDLRASVAHANASLTQYLENTGVQDSGCTMAAAVVHNGVLYIANVGDSRVYLIRDGHIYQQTHDHTLTQQKLARGLIRPDQVELDPDRSVLTRSLGAVPSVDVDLFTLSLNSGDLVLLCSDGLTDMLVEADIARIASSASPHKAVKKLIAAANKNGGLDNVSVILARIDGKSAPSGGFFSDFSKFTPARKAVLMALGGLLVLTVIALSLLAGWQAFGRWGGDGTSMPGNTVAISPTVLVSVPVGGGTEEGILLPVEGGATSTPRPTSTATPTLMPLSTLTETPEPPATPTVFLLTPTPKLDDDDDDDNGEEEKEEKEESNKHEEPGGIGTENK